MTAVRLEGVTKQFANGMTAVNGVDLTIKSGELTAVIGPSGAGKSTLFRLINGLEEPSTGRVNLGEGSSSATGDLRGRVGTVFQHYNLVGRLSVMTNVLTGRLHQRSWLGSMFYLFRNDDYEVAAKALDRVGLLDRAWDRADKLSGGQQQRVGIARALAQQSKVLLADEPVSSLDPANSEQIMAILSDLSRTDGITTLINLHQVDLAKRYAQRIVGLRAGQIVFDGPPDQLTDDQLSHLYNLDGAAMPSREQADQSSKSQNQNQSPVPAKSASNQVKTSPNKIGAAGWQPWPGNAPS